MSGTNRGLRGSAVLTRRALLTGLAALLAAPLDLDQRRKLWAMGWSPTFGPRPLRVEPWKPYYFIFERGRILGARAFELATHGTINHLVLRDDDGATYDRLVYEPGVSGLTAISSGSGPRVREIRANAPDGPVIADVRPDGYVVARPGYGRYE